MNHKTAVRIAVIMVIVFGLTVILYPMLFKPNADAPVEAPVTEPLKLPQ